MAIRSVPNLLALAVDRDPDAPSISCGEETISRAEPRARTNRIARSFAELGVRKGTMQRPVGFRVN